MTVVQFGLAELGLVQEEMEGLASDRLVLAGQLDQDEASRPAGLGLGRADPHHQLIPAGKAVSHRTESSQQSDQLAAAHRLLFGAPSFTLGQHKQFAILGKQ